MPDTDLVDVNYHPPITTPAEEVVNWFRKVVSEANSAPGIFKDLSVGLIIPLEIASAMSKSYCTKCGKCCKFFCKIILFNIDKPLIDTMSEEFKSKYLKVDKTEIAIEKGKGNACPYLKDGLCEVYKLRPSTCTTYPIQHDLLGNTWINVIPGCECSLKIIEEDWSFRQALYSQESIRVWIENIRATPDEWNYTGGE